MGSSPAGPAGHPASIKPFSSTPSAPPARPDPSADPGVIPRLQSPQLEDDSFSEDIFELKPVTALKMLCRSIDLLVKITGDVPPTPPVHSRHASPARSAGDGVSNAGNHTAGKENFDPQRGRDQLLGVPPSAKTPIGSPEAHLTEPIHIIGAQAQPVYIQQGAIARKFYSKRPPPISTEEYLMRMHRYCPMSTGVYLATSCYIHRLAIVERVIPVTPRNVHRLLLAGLRVAMKALEDLNWPHGRFSKVGGVSEVELGRLEITFCFLMDFELKVDAEMLQQVVESYKGVSSQESSLRFALGMPPKGEKRKASSTISRRPILPIEVPATS